MSKENFIERAAEILYRAGKKKVTQLPDPEKEAQKLAHKMSQIKNSDQIGRVFDHNVKEILKRIKKL